MTDKQIKEVFKNGFYCIEPCPEIKELQAELKRKEQECEKLKEKVKKSSKQASYEALHLLREFRKVDKQRYNWREKAEKLKQTITEIKEIAERNIYLKSQLLFYDGDLGQFQHQPIVEILQKISEVEK